MAEYDYITRDDISAQWVKRFPDNTVDEYVDEANDYFEDLCASKGVAPDDIKRPVGRIAKRCMIAYTAEFMADDLAGNTDIMKDKDRYERIALKNMERRTRFENHLTSEVVRGVANNQKKSWAVSTGRMFRSS
jgi:hypothetical protein